MATARDIIQDAYETLNIYSPGETLDADDLSRGFIVLNRMVESFTNENLMTHEIQETTFTLTPGTQQYTVGTGGAISTVARPLAITQAFITDGGNNRFLMNIKPRDRWNQIGNVGSNITSQIPTDLFYDPQYPLGVINIFPSPLAAYTLSFDSMLLLTSFSTVTHTLSAPPGYHDMYVNNLAVRLGVYFRDTPVPQDVKDLAAESKAVIKRTNLPEIIANYDGSLLARPSMTFNIYRGSYN